MKNNIILIGFMGVGKGTLARALSKATQHYCIDTDDLIESLENKKIKTIFKLYGESYFRDLEKQTAQWLHTLDKTIISTGGGFYKQNIHEIGQVVYLKSSFDGILNRIYNAPNSKKKLKKRPLLQDLEKAKILFDTRTKEYAEVADIIIDVENREISEIISEIDSKWQR